MKKYIICSVPENGENNAGFKAGRDAMDIAVANGYQFIEAYRTKEGGTSILNLLSGYWCIKKLCQKVERGDIVLLQYPMNRQFMKFAYKKLNKYGVHIVTLIHDIDFFRNVPLRKKGVEEMRRLELSLLAQSEYLICHNSFMIAALKKEGLRNNFVSLGVFDYLYNGKEAEKTSDNSLIVAGNLLEQKAGYIYKLKNHKFKLSLYGSNLSESFDDNNAEYHGSFSPGRLIENLKGTYGLVWDGNEIDTCSGNYGQYLKINNPHKLSLYIAAGLPVVVWKQSALYPFVVENGLGFGVESLLEIDEEIARQNYDVLTKNVKVIQNKVQQGEFLKKALVEIESSCENKQRGIKLHGV